MVPKLDELISAYVLLVLGWNIMKNTDFDNFGRFDPISGHFGPVHPAGPILLIFKIEHFVAVFSLILGWKIWKKNFSLSLDYFWMILVQMAELARRRRNGFFRNRALLRIFSVILRWKIMKNQFLTIFRWILDDFGPNGPFGPTAPKWLYSKLTILFRFFVILGGKICFLLLQDDFWIITAHMAWLAQRSRNEWIENQALFSSFSWL